ncbi:hypothetical protein M5K25_026009 [Dendrobium thyrsiflorum]|uniref:Uncharacterized protein n=1 Tax=Dendrobium thyrsiflorum TaxID=117978 RepID=A0ABD0TW83_DENTH
MADPKRDFGMVYDEQAYVQILNSTFFDVDPEIDHTLEGYVERIFDTLVDAIEEPKRVECGSHEKNISSSIAEPWINPHYIYLFRKFFSRRLHPSPIFCRRHRRLQPTLSTPSSPADLVEPTQAKLRRLNLPSPCPRRSNELQPPTSSRRPALAQAKLRPPSPLANPTYPSLAEPRSSSLQPHRRPTHPSPPPTSPTKPPPTKPPPSPLRLPSVRGFSASDPCPIGPPPFSV